MAEAAEYGLMLLDGKSKGTVDNVVNLSRDHKPVVVYVAPTRQLGTVERFDDLKRLARTGIQTAWSASSASCTWRRAAKSAG